MDFNCVCDIGLFTWLAYMLREICNEVFLYKSIRFVAYREYS